MQLLFWWGPPPLLLSQVITCSAFLAQQLTAMSVSSYRYVMAYSCIFRDFTATSSGVLGFDVLPNGHTKSTELKYRVEVSSWTLFRSCFSTKSDAVNGGKVKLVCSQGLHVISLDGSFENGSQDWHNSCGFDLGSCLPDSTSAMIASVKSETIDSNSPNVSDQKQDDYRYSCL